jgi:DNA/RNA endonuclease YhcR with UshA esterase domain
MKTKKYILFALAVLGLTTSCMKGDWDAPSPEDGMASYGNQDIKATNLKTIAEVKALYANEINNNSLAQITQPMQIQGIVTGNDVGGNIYNSLYIQDNTGAIAISIGQGGLYGAFSVGQTVLIELNGLYIGGYGKQPQLGTTYTNPNKEGATPQVGRMTRYAWGEHYKLVPSIDGLIVNPLEVKYNLNSLDIAKDCGKLITLKGVELGEADGKAVFAPSDGSVTLTANCANRTIKGVSNVVLRTSTYADFAKQPLPTGRVDITGVASRYNDTWQFLMRDYKDIKESQTEPAPEPTPKGNGTQADPYNAAGVAAYTKTLGADKQSDKDIYTTGIITAISEIDTEGTYGNATYLISDDANGYTGTFQIYRGLGLNGEKFSKAGAKLIKVGDVVTIKGKVVNYKGNTPQYAQGSTIVKLNDEGGEDTPPTPTESNVIKNIDGTVVTLTNTSVTASANTITVDLSQQGWENSKEPSTVTLSDGTTISFDKGEGSTTPKYYDGTKGVRVYAKNFIKIAGSSKAIAKVVLNCDSYNGTDYIGNGLLYGLADGLTMFIYNENTEASGGVQLRVKTIEITYAD